MQDVTTNSELPAANGWQGRERIAGLVLVALGGLGLWGGADLPFMTSDGVGSGLIPPLHTSVSRVDEELARELHDFAAGTAGHQARTSFSPRREAAPRIGFIMSGQGPQWWGMGRELMKNEPVFRQTMEACAHAMQPHARFSLLEELARDENVVLMFHTFFRVMAERLTSLYIYFYH